MSFNNHNNFSDREFERGGEQPAADATMGAVHGDTTGYRPIASGYVERQLRNSRQAIARSLGLLKATTLPATGQPDGAGGASENGSGPGDSGLRRSSSNGAERN